MKLHFDPNQEYQLQAVKSVVDLFEGQPLNKGDYEFSLSPAGSSLFNESGVGNELLVAEEQILQNLKSIQERNGVKPSFELAGMNFSMEMETGTGKTYVYLRTVYELNKNYGFKKFVIVVPSVAIREGVLKNLEITHEHFQEIYGKTPVNFKVYDSAKVSDLRGFAMSNAVQIMVINIDSFAKAENVMNKPNDKLTGRKPVEFIRAVRPIVIVDEPQNMETDNRKAAIAKLSPMCTLRYSATHTNLYNLVYSLNPVKAYDMGLVKQIEVDSVFTENDFTRAYVCVESVKAAKTKITAKIKIDYNAEEGVVRKAVNAKIGDDLFDLSNKREIYKDGFIINSIDAKSGTVEFSNGEIVSVGVPHGGLTDEIMKVQIEKTIDEHLDKEIKLKNRGIKVLSLFFIDKVANYRTYDEAGNPVKGKYAEWFESIFAGLAKKKYKGIISYKPEEVHNGYFAQDKKGVFKDSSENRETLADDDVYHLIMKDKERLLDINTPLRFIFSHSALREGWDNPNVFQICTLNETKSELKKRQEIGRGMRLAVNQEGERTHDRNVNKLTVIANESYEEFAEKLQKEIQDDCGVEFTGRVKDKRHRVKVKLKKNYKLDANFVALWNKIKEKTKYKVEYQTGDLIRNAVKLIKEMQEVKKPVIKSIRVDISMVSEGIKTQQTGVNVFSTDAMIREIPDIIGYVQGKTELTRDTIYNILKQSGRLKDALKNPQMFLDLAVSRVQTALDELKVDGIKYEKIAGKEYEMRLFEDSEVEAYKEHLHAVTRPEKTLTDYIETISGPEERFAADCESNNNVEFYIKLPHWFKIATPIGPYNPDWALIFKNESRIYFVAETKSALDPSKRRPEENLKIECGKAHFNKFDGIKYAVVTKVDELL